jgi:hypothetical protein
MSGWQRGRDRETRVVDLFRGEGFVSYRLAHGCADVVVLRAGFPPMLVQVKSTRRPWERFGRLARLELAHEAIAAGAIAKLCHWPVGAVSPRFYDSHEWPTTPGMPAVTVGAA